jgi:hypothetical protein
LGSKFPHQKAYPEFGCAIFTKKTMLQSKTLRFSVCIAGFTMLACCAIPNRHGSTALLSHFKTPATGDTLHIEIIDETVGRQDTIPNSLFFSSIPSALLQQIDYLADSSAALVLGRQKIQLDAHFSAYWVEIQQSWFKHNSLFLYDQSKQQFTDRITVAEWFGGDGGQILTGSWVFDYDGDGKKDIIVRDIQHSVIPTDDGDAVEKTHESASILLWKNGRFIDTPFQDTATLIRRFPIQSYW